MSVNPISAKIFKYYNRPVFKAGLQRNGVFLEDNLKQNFVEETGNDGQTYISLEEPKLRKQTDSGKKDNILDIYFKQVNKYPLLSPEEEQILVKEAFETKNERAKQLLINSNLRFVISIAKKYTGMGLSLLDLIQEGNIGLIKSLKTYDYKQGYRFCSYAVYGIEQSINGALRDKANIVRIPISMHKKVFEIKNAVAELTQKLGRAPSVQEIADRLDLPESKVSSALKSVQHKISIDAPIHSEDDSKKVIDFIPSEQPESDDYDAIRLSCIKIMFKKLSLKEQAILNLKFGINNKSPKTIDEIALMYGISRQRVSEIARNALNRLKKLCNFPEQIILRQF